MSVARTALATATTGIKPASADERDPLGRLLAALGLSLYGYTFAMVAIMVLLLEVTGSPAAAAAYLVVRSAPRCLGAKPGGHLSDRVGPHRVAALCSAIQAAATAVVLLAGALHAAWLIYAAVGVAGFASGMFQPATMALTPRVIRASGLARANTAYNGIVASAVLAPPALSVPLLAFGGPNLPLAIDVAGFVAAAVLMLTLTPRHSGAGGEDHAGHGASLGLFLRERFLRSLAVSWAAEGMVAGAAQGAFIAAAADRFGGDGKVGLLYAAVGVGSLLGTAALLRLQPARVPRLAVIGAALLSVVALGLFAIAGNIWLAMVMLATAGLGNALYQTWGTTQLQRDVDPALLGRASGTVVTMNIGGIITGALAVALLIPAIGWTHALLAVSGAGVLLMLLLATPRRADVAALRRAFA